MVRVLLSRKWKIYDGIILHQKVLKVTNNQANQGLIEPWEVGQGHQ